MTQKKAEPLLWTRREAILKASAMLGGATLVGQSLMLAGCERSETEVPATEEPQDSLFSDAELRLLDEIAETILPETETPGAKAAAVGPFIALMVTDTYSPEEQEVFTEGLATIDRECQQAHGRNFVELSSAERLAIAERLDRERFDAGESIHYFRMLKELSVLGFFTSEVAYNEILEYVETPGRYDGCRELTPAVRMHAGHGSSPFNT
ncbi:MAG: gluconate 2-dehydrogenase subunit 3 family protein [Woeseiaceae bacterium]|nr:gluconate 2-dehydrogenase subunit 3 family protein [Woeseiaceae bacterium]